MAKEVKKAAGTQRNSYIARGVLAFSKSTNQDKTGRWRFAGKGGAKKAPKAAASPKLEAGKFYPADVAPQPLRRQFKPKTAKLRANITPGTVLIVLAGRFAGKRVVFLKQLASGLLLVTGPFKLNGVPLRRVNQAYVIATSKKVDVSGVKLPENVNDAFFAAEGGKDTTDFFSTDKPQAVVIPEARKAAQKAVDGAIISKLDKVTNLYLGSKFSLSKGQYPHALKF